MNILITNSVPLNGGDEALLRATYISLSNIFPGANITVLCMNAELCKKYIKDLSIDSDLEFVTKKEKSLFERICYKIFRADIKIKSKSERRVRQLYKKADLIVSSAGGFLHDHYPISERLDGFEFAFSLNKPVILFAQSIGPFWKPSSVQRIRSVLTKVTAVILRDEISREHLAEIMPTMSNVYVTADAAFLWRNLLPRIVTRKGKVSTVALCFRNWPIKDDKISDTLNKATQLCLYLFERGINRIVFLSTCQGVHGYTDDSSHARTIVDLLPDFAKGKCEVDGKRYSPEELIKRYSEFDAFIGMRLHGAILSMLGGTPALGLGYESKTKGIFTSLGLQEYQVDYDKPFDEWRDCVSKFLQDIDLIREKLGESLDRVAKTAQDSLTITKNKLREYEGSAKK